MDTYQAIVVENGNSEGRLIDRPVRQITKGEVRVAVRYSSVNYKDALAVTGQGKILRRFPMTPGIDCCGEVVETQHPSFNVGDPVLVTGTGLGENEDGGLAQQVVIAGSHCIGVPEGLTFRESMAIGTAGFTAGLCIERLTDNHQRPLLGPMVVTGASGGVGVMAVQMLHQVGFEVIAVSNKPALVPMLRELGAGQVVTTEELALGTRPLETARFGGAIDNVGGEILAGLLAATQLWGNVASVGLALSHELHTTVMPHILRGVSLLGISSNNCPMALRKKIWARLATDLKPKSLEAMISREIGLDGVPAVAREMLSRKTYGRILVKL